MTKNATKKSSVFSAHPSAGAHRDSETLWAVAERAFEYAYREFPEADLGWVPTEEQAKQIRTDVVLPGLKARGVKPSSSYTAERIQVWFQDWKVYYPFVDPIAVDKAVGFHRAAWEALTVREHRAVVQRLGKMRDPWEDDGIIRPPAGEMRKGDTRTPQGVTPRGRRWLQYTPEERRVLFDQVARFKRSAV